MTGALWSALGVTTVAAILYATLGMTRPRDRGYLSFAWMMTCLAVYIVFEWELYRATSIDAAVEALRWQVIAAHGVLAGILVFVPAYTRARIPRWMFAFYWGALGFFFVANLWVPYGVWLSGRPSLSTLLFRGGQYTLAVAPPMGALQYAHELFVISAFALTFGCALGMIRRGERLRGIMLALALVLALLQHVLDVVRDVVAGSWPYGLEFALVAWGLIMSIQLAIDFRRGQTRLYATFVQAKLDADNLARTIERSLRVRDQLNTPLQTLELGLALWPARDALGERKLADVRSSVARLADLGHAVEDTVKLGEGPRNRRESGR